MGMKNSSNYLRANKVPTVVFDKGRRGNPLPGCDCVVCFGYCMVDGDKAERDRFAKEKKKGEGD